MLGIAHRRRRRALLALSAPHMPTPGPMRRGFFRLDAVASCRVHQCGPCRRQCASRAASVASARPSHVRPQGNDATGARVFGGGARRLRGRGPSRTPLAGRPPIVDEVEDEESDEGQHVDGHRCSPLVRRFDPHVIALISIGSARIEGRADRSRARGALPALRRARDVRALRDGPLPAVHADPISPCCSSHCARLAVQPDCPSRSGNAHGSWGSFAGTVSAIADPRGRLSAPERHDRWTFSISL
jgi:hypothetical protein